MKHDRKLRISIGKSRKSLNWDIQEIYWSELVNKLGSPIRTTETYEEYKKLDSNTRGNLKDVGGFVGGILKDNRRKAENVVSRSLICLDADNIEPGETERILSILNGLGCAYCTYSTRSHCRTKPRLRIIIPLSEDCTPDEYEPIARYVANVIDMKIMDKTTFEASRLMYWPSCSSDSEFIFSYLDKPFLDGKEVLKFYKNWKDTKEWPHATDEYEIIKKEIKKLGDPSLKEGIVGAFCSVYDVYKAIDSFLSDVYVPGDFKDKYTHVGSTTTNGAVVYDNGWFMHSYHATDPACGKNCNAFDLVRIHKFGHLDKDTPEDKNGKARPSFNAMCKFVEELPEIKDYRYQKAIEDFKNDPSAGLAPVFYENNKFKIKKFCEYVAQNEHIVLINDELYIYANGVYVQDENLIQRKFLMLIPEMLKAKRNECIEYLKLIVPVSENKDFANYAAFKNGLYNIETGILEQARPELIVTNLIPHDYREGAYNELVDKVLNKVCCYDAELRALLEEMIGYSFYRSNIYRKSFFLYGPSSDNGKSVFLNFLKNILGCKNYSSLDFKELGDRFKTAELVGKLANIGDDITEKFNTSSSIFKKLSTGETINVERKGRDPFDFNNYAKLIFSANRLPRTEDKSSGTGNKRMCIIPFNAKFKPSDNDYDPKINSKLKREECIEYGIALGIKGLSRLVKNGDFTKASAVEKTKKDYEAYNNQIVGFLQAMADDENYDIEKYTPVEVYNQYKYWCIENGYQPVNNGSFGSEMKMLGYENVRYRNGDKGELKRKYARKEPGTKK